MGTTTLLPPSGTSGSTTAINISQVGGASIGLGQTTPASSFPVIQAIPSSIGVGVATMSSANVAVQLPSSVFTQGFVLTANASNISPLYVGPNSSVSSSNGYGLQVGASVGVAATNSNLLYIINSTSSDGVSFIGS